MKRNNEKVPEFDEIIFENRNKTYGAFDLRKRYKSAASISILCATAVSALLITAFSFTPDKKTALPLLPGYEIKISLPQDQVVVPPPEIKPPSELIRSISNLEPKVVTDSLEATPNIPITDLINSTVKDRKVTDTVAFTEPITPEIPVEEKIFVVVEEKPEFPGGNSALFKFISENVIYPDEAQKNNIQGRVILKFVVEPDGSVGKILILRGIDSLLDSEAIRVVKALPKFRPGRQAGIAVPVWFSLPVFFQIQND